jgi:hypothetical protein
MTDNFTYQVANASQEKLGRAHYVIDLKEERLITSSEAFSYLKELRRARELRDAIRQDYEGAGIRHGWEPKLAATPHLEKLVLHLSHVFGVMAMNEHIPTPHHNLYQSSVITKGKVVEVSIVVPEHEEIVAESLAFDHGSGELMSVRMFAPERTVPWKLTLTSRVSPEKLLSSCCRGVTWLRDSDQRDVGELAQQLNTLSEQQRSGSPLSMGESMLLLGMLSGMSEVPFEARITIGEIVSSPFQLPKFLVFEEERLGKALRAIPSSLSQEIFRDTRTAALKQSPGYPFPVSVPWGVVFERAQNIENVDPGREGDIRSERFRRAVGLAFIENLPPESFARASRVETAISFIDDWLDALRDRPKDDPRILRFRTLREILANDSDYFESIVPPVRRAL